MRRAGLLALLVVAGASAHASPDDGYDYKLTLGLYRPQGAPGDAGRDLNLRWRHADSSAWIGAYRDSVTNLQWRAGWDTRWQPIAGTPVALLPSVQVASGGFAGGSLVVEAGQRWFAQAGLGRTNLRPYVNLNFDPNDALLAAAGYRGEHAQVAVNLIRDNRLDTGQQHLHLNMQQDFGEHDRLTLDLLRKHGRGDMGWVSATGLTLTYDHGATFMRLAYDPYQNFSAATVWRLSGGLRF